MATSISDCKKIVELVKKLHLAGVSGGDVEKVWAEHCGQTIDETWAAVVPAKTK